MANTIKIKRGSGSDPSASDMVLGEPVLRTDTAELFFKKDDGSVAKVSGGGGGPDFKYLELRNAANNGAASYPANDFTLVTSGTTNAITPAAANTLLVSVNGVIQKPNAGTSTSGITGFIVDGSRFKTATNLTQAPDFIIYQESGGIGEPSDNTVSEAKLKVSNSPVNGYFLSAQSGNTGGLTWAAPIATSCTGNSATATALETARTINGTSFDGTANITVTAAAGTLTGTTLNSSVVTSSLTSLGDLSGLTVNGNSSLRHILVQADSTYDIGTTSTRYRNVYADAYYGDGSNLTGISSTNNFVNSASFDTGNGVLTLGRSGLGNVTVDLDGRFATGTIPTNNNQLINGRGFITGSGNTTGQARFLENSRTGSAPNYALRAWVNFDGRGSISIRGNGNVSSISDFGTGNYRVNFSTSMADGNYSTTTMGGYDNTGGTAPFIIFSNGGFDGSPLQYNSSGVRCGSTYADFRYATLMFAR